MIDFSISTSFIRAELTGLQRLIGLGDFRKTEIGFYDEDTLPLVMDFAVKQGLSFGFPFSHRSG
jgi:hypothetical protein